ncbi:MAG: FtsX-like permease family protein, partial [Acidobacteriota bacterium]|nr:FtsX-like permease family protein [Acidobacteriota bacterium]
FSFDTYAVVPLPAFMKAFSARLDTSIRVKVRDKNRLEAARDELTGAMRRVRGLEPEQKDDFSINAQNALRSTIDPIKSGIAAAGLFVTGLALFVGAIGIMNITYVSVKERTREIGTRKAVGATPAQIFFQMLTESVLVSVFGGILGIFAGKFFTQGISMLTRNPAIITPGVIMNALIFAAGTGLVFGMYPAIRASRLNPIEALRTE